MKPNKDGTLSRLDKAIWHTGCSEKQAQAARSITQALTRCSVFWHTDREDGRWIEWFDGNELLIKLFVIPDDRRIMGGRAPEPNRGCTGSGQNLTGD